MPRLVTSATEFYLQERGGLKFIETFKKHWPKSVELIIYYEGDIIRDDDGNVKWHWIEEVEDWQEWERRISHFPTMIGKVGTKYEVQLDARHWRKAFIEAHAVNRYSGKVFWLDSDVVTFADVPETFLDECLPDDKMCCYFGRQNFYSETSFIGWNADHPLTRHFFHMYLQFFKSGAIFTQPSWHDCQGFDVVRTMINRPDLFVDMAEGLPENMHPFINGSIGRFCDHQKRVSRKNKGSFKSDLVVERTEPYWQTVREKGPNAQGVIE